MIAINPIEWLDVLLRLEWSAYATGPSIGREAPQVFRACPICRGVKSEDFVRDVFPLLMIGHRDGCALRAMRQQLQRAVTDAHLLSDIPQ